MLCLFWSRFLCFFFFFQKISRGPLRLRNNQTTLFLEQDSLWDKRDNQKICGLLSSVFKGSKCKLQAHQHCIGTVCTKANVPKNHVFLWSRHSTTQTTQHRQHNTDNTHTDNTDNNTTQHTYIIPCYSHAAAPLNTDHTPSSARRTSVRPHTDCRGGPHCGQ